MISPKLKDRILGNLCENCTLEVITDFTLEDLNIAISLNDAYGVLSQFQRLGYLSELNYQSGLFSICRHLKAIDFYRLGGFSIKELATKETLDKLKLEVQNLKKSFPKKASTFTSIITNITTISSFFLSR